MPRRWSVLLVTDLHYVAPNTNFADDDKELGRLPGLRHDIFVDFNAVLQAFDPGSFDIVAVCGDVTSHGDPLGFDRFRTKGLPHLLKLVHTPAAVCVVPGNHDVKWNLDPRTRGAFERKFRDFENLIRGQDVTSCLLPSGQLTKNVNDHLLFRRPHRGPVYVDRERKVIGVCLNSAIRCGERNVRMADGVDAPLKKLVKGIAPASDAVSTTLHAVRKTLQRHVIRDVAHVTKAQQTIIRDELVTLKEQLGEDWPEYLRLAILHHHVGPFPAQAVEHRGYEQLVDAGHVLAFFGEFDFDLILTGHKHQAYVVPYVVKQASGNHEMLLIGGPTVGGASVNESFRGARVVDVSEDDGRRSFRVSDIPYQWGQGDTRKRLLAARQNGEPHSVARSGTGFEHRARVAGFSYREVASITLIDLDGDAKRVVECEDLVVMRSDVEHARGHRVTLPPTSGYLANLTVKGRQFEVSVDAPIPRDARRKDWAASLIFGQRPAGPQPVSYRYDWYAVNAFALNQHQFRQLHRRTTDQVEFTHFRVDDPVQDLTVVVRFPEGYAPTTAPRLRVARPTPDEPDSRQWELDTEKEHALERSHALRFYESLDTAALRVRWPTPGLSYGIEWDVPEATYEPDEQDKRAVVDAFWESGQNGRFDAEVRSKLRDLLVRLMQAARSGLIGEWSGPVDASLMWFDARADQPLSVLAAALQTKPRGASDFQYEVLAYRVSLPYGEGIAGRALKTNRPRVYVAPRVADRAAEPDFYTQMPEGLPHKVLVSLPVHIPDGRFAGRTAVYDSKHPYGVLSFGSIRPDCPLSKFRVHDHTYALLRFRHEANGLIFEHLKGIVEGL